VLLLNGDEDDDSWGSAIEMFGESGEEEEAIEERLSFRGM
jgi:hypothetical protein